MSNDDDTNVHRLEASGAQIGGLFIPGKKDKKSIIDAAIPKASLLGLDKLANKLRQDPEKRLSFKSSADDDDTELHSKMSSSSETHTFAVPFAKMSGSSKDHRHYREPRIETPSYTGGVDARARDKAKERERSGKDKGLHASSSKDRKRRDRHDDDSRGGKSSRRDRDSSRRSRRENRDEPKTPRYRHSDSNWEWDDDKPSGSQGKSSWDFPTPKSYSKKEDGSSRSTKRYYDDTPRATPGYRLEFFFFEMFFKNLF